MAWGMSTRTSYLSDIWHVSGRICIRHIFKPWTFQQLSIKFEKILHCNPNIGSITILFEVFLVATLFSVAVGYQRFGGPCWQQHHTRSQPRRPRLESLPPGRHQISRNKSDFGFGYCLTAIIVTFEKMCTLLFQLGNFSDISGRKPNLCVGQVG
jgi:hypothetical protein